jgi:four helix bundle protein
MTEKTFVYGFEKLEVWKLAREFNKFIYEITDDFPYSEMKNLTSQIRRSSVSISANIAEGSSRFSNKDFKRYLQISYGSAIEVLSHFYLAYDRNYIEDSTLNNIKQKVNQITRMLNSLSYSLKI